jgi:hypothetical protein
VSARANWFMEALDGLDDQPDPFSQPIEEVGQRIDLRDPQAALEIRLTELLRREGNLEHAGITCPVKARSDTTCHACPISQAGTDTALSVLCRIGREQESVLTELAVLRWQGQ